MRSWSQLRPFFGQFHRLSWELELPNCAVQVVQGEIQARGTQICRREYEKKANLKNGVKLREDFIECRCMHVNQVQKLIKWNEKEACEESFRNDDYCCKNMKTHATPRKGSL